VGTVSLRSGALLLVLLTSAPAAADDAGTSWLGIGIDSGVSGVRVTQVFPLTPAFAAGLEEGDEIVAVGRRHVASISDLQASIRSRSPGSAVSVEVARGGSRFRLQVVLESMPSHAERLARVLVGRPAPAIALEPVAGPPVRGLADLRGRVAVLAFVASFDEASRTALEALAVLAAEHGSELSVLAVSLENPDALRGFASRLSPALSVAHDPDGRASRAYLVEAELRPQLVVVDAHGVVRHADALENPGVDMGDGPAPLDELIDGALFAARRELRRAARR
jgi:peroxiredoxin